MIKYLFSDIDGTLYIREDVFAHDVAACHKFVEQGGIFSLATGRSDMEIVNFANEENFPNPKFRISCNGALTICANKKIEKFHFSTKALQFLATEIYNNLYEFSIIELNSTNKVHFLMEPEEWVLNYKGQDYEIKQNALKELMQQKEPIMKMYIEGNQEFLAQLIQKIDKDFAAEIEVFNDLTAINVGARGTSKGSAILNIMEKYHIQPEEIAVIGDAANDIPMFHVTPNSFTFHHAQAFIKEEAEYVVASVAEAVEWILAYNKRQVNEKIGGYKNELS